MIEQRRSPEMGPRVEYTVLADVDGVWTSPDTKKAHPLLLEFTANECLNDRPIGLATGRDLGWVDKNVISLIQPHVPASKFDNLFISCEKGTVTATYKDGKRTVSIDEQYAVPDEIGEIIQEITSRSSLVFFDPKESMYSVEVTGWNNDSEMAAQQAELGRIFREIRGAVQSFGGPFKTEQTVIAVDVYHNYVSKQMSSRAFVNFLEAKGIDPKTKNFLTLGDSASDVELSRGLRNAGMAHVSFGFVGPNRPKFDEYTHLMTPDPGNSYDQGTLSILKRLGLVGIS